MSYSNSLDTSTFGGLTKEFSVKNEGSEECSSAHNLPAESSPQGILPPWRNIRSTMTMGELDAAYFSFKFPDCIQVRHLEANEKVDDALAEGLEPFYLRRFEISLMFPLMGLVEELCTWVGIHPSQLVPFIFRLLLCMDRLKEKYNLDFSAEDFFYSYFVKREKPDTRYFF